MRHCNTAGVLFCETEGSRALRAAPGADLVHHVHPVAAGALQAAARLGCSPICTVCTV